MESSHVYIPPDSEIPNRIRKEACKDQIAARECYVAMLEMDDHLQVLNIEEWRVTVEPIEDIEKISLDDDLSGWITRIGTQVDPTVCKELTFFLRNNQDVFAWSHEDMPGISPTVMVHKLNVNRPSLSFDWRRNFLLRKKTKS